MKYIERTNWQEQKHLIQLVNSEFYNIVEELELGDDLPLYYAKYPYGTKLLDKGRLQVINNNGAQVDLLDQSIDKNIQNELGYPITLPMGIVIKKKIELYHLNENRSIPYLIFNPGSLFALSAVLDSSSSFDEGDFWEATAGIRTITLTQKFSDKRYLRNFEKKLHLSLFTPTAYSDQWELFKQLAPVLDPSWEVELIYFPQQWLPPSVRIPVA